MLTDSETKKKELSLYNNYSHIKSTWLYSNKQRKREKIFIKYFTTHLNNGRRDTAILISTSLNAQSYKLIHTEDRRYLKLKLNRTEKEARTTNPQHMFNLPIKNN